MTWRASLQSRDRTLARWARLLAYATALVMNAIGLTVGGLMKADCGVRLDCALAPELVGAVWCVAGIVPAFVAHVVRRSWFKCHRPGQL